MKPLANVPFYTLSEIKLAVTKYTQSSTKITRVKTLIISAAFLP